MKKLLFLFAALLLVGICLPSCGDDNDWSQYYQWRDDNTEWLNAEAERTNADGSKYYTIVTAPWNPEASVLIHYYNDRSLTAGNLQPLFTSTVKTKYRGELYNGYAFDSSYLNTDSVFITTPGEVVDGWAIALTNMRVGDSVHVVIPYWCGYGTTLSGTIPPYSNLIFDMVLKDVVAYETKP